MYIKFCFMIYMAISIFLLFMFIGSATNIFSAFDEQDRQHITPSTLTSSVFSAIFSLTILTIALSSAVELLRIDTPKIETVTRVDTYNPNDVKIKTLATETIKIDLQTSKSLFYHDEHTTGTMTKRVAGVGDYVILDNGVEAEITSTVSDPKLKDVQIKVSVTEEFVKFDKGSKREFSTILNKLFVKHPGHPRRKKDSDSNIKEIFAEIHHPQVEE